MNKITTLFLIAILAFLATKCASIRPPEGGKKDLDAPQLLAEKSVPLNKSTNYKAPLIKLVFDEYIEVKNLRKELIITPSTNVNYSSSAKKNVFTLAFDSLLESNTTYTLNFGNAIVDITEKNKARNIKVVFSTGNEIDSLYIKGNIKHLMTNKLAINTSVLLYKKEATLALKEKPYYFSKTDSAGNYALENLRSGEYQIFALIDDADNFKYTERGEKIAFLNTSVKVDSSITDLNFSLLDYDNETLKIKKATSQKQYIEIELSKTPLKYSLDFSDWKDKIAHSSTGNNIRLYNLTKNESDSLLVYITVQDSLLNEIQDTLKVKFNIPKKQKETTFSFKKILQPKMAVIKSEPFDVLLNFTKPIKTLSLDSILMIVGKDTSFIDTTIIQLRKSNNQLVIRNLKTDSLFAINIRKGALISVENDTLKRTSLRFAAKKQTDYGSIEGRVETQYEHFTIQLLDEKFKLEAEIKNKKNFRFDYVKAGTKILRILIDENNNGKWDKGSFQDKIQAEKVFIHQKKIMIKANWEIRDEVLKIE